MVREFSIEASADDARESAVRALEEMGFTVERSSDGLTATQGSQFLTRLLGNLVRVV